MDPHDQSRGSNWRAVASLTGLAILVSVGWPAAALLSEDWYQFVFVASFLLIFSVAFSIEFAGVFHPRKPSLRISANTEPAIVETMGRLFERHKTRSIPLATIRTTKRSRLRWDARNKIPVCDMDVELFDGSEFRWRDVDEEMAEYVQRGLRPASASESVAEGSGPGAAAAPRYSMGDEAPEWASGRFPEMILDLHLERVLGLTMIPVMATLLFVSAVWGPTAPRPPGLVSTLVLVALLLIGAALLAVSGVGRRENPQLIEFWPTKLRVEPWGFFGRRREILEVGMSAVVRVFPLRDGSPREPIGIVVELRNGKRIACGPLSPPAASALFEFLRSRWQGVFVDLG